MEFPVHDLARVDGFVALDSPQEKLLIIAEIGPVGRTADLIGITRTGYEDSHGEHGEKYSIHI
jgi:hypothetical protein